jgi:hypothetical protein
MLIVCLVSVQAIASVPSRIRFLIHDNIKIDSVGELRVHFIPAGNYVGTIAPFVFLGLGLQPTSWLDVEPVIGWAFDNDELALSTRIMTTHKQFWTWTDFEVYPCSGGYYWFSQVDYKLTSWCHTGLEAEGWGAKHEVDFSWGIGSNILLRYKKTGLDIAGQYRKDNKKEGLGLVLRIHIFF